MAAPRSLTLELPDDPAERRRTWAAALAPFYDMAPTDVDPAPGALALTRHRLGALTLLEMEAPAQTLRRTPGMAVGPGRDDLLVLFSLDGEVRVTWSGGAAAFGRLQGVLLDLARPATLVAGPLRATGLVLPRGLVTDRGADPAALHGAVFDLAGDPVSRLFFTCVQNLAETASALADDQIPHVTRTVAILGSAALRRLKARPIPSDREISPDPCLTGRLPAEPASAPALGIAPEEMRRSLAIRGFIRSELGSPDLSVETIAGRFGLSRAGLYRLFSEEGGVQRLIREQRLARAMAMLARPRGAGRPRVSTVAHTCGFPDGKTFSRAFKRRFGLLPSAVGPASLPHDETGSAPHRPEEIAA